MKHTMIHDMLSRVRDIDTWAPLVFEAKMNISLVRYEILSRLLLDDSLIQVDLQEMLNLDRAAMSRHLGILEDKGYVVRNRNPENKREVVVTISEEGRRVMQSCCDTHDVFNERLMEGISEASMEVAIGVLETLRENVNHIMEGNNDE
ncbi:MarR family transcriptional regulator [Erysipelothrix sp. HDW6C]|uniref:MarR family winged helix-turn-helix transcriptional regulator n=1 Tax=Erysipelothrix sp. HDW6C TaxID=2714930 RepID=UPI001409DAC2|nr:MarR family transcriptional regulator [Erysipelothrix sp. HDW6C]QIK70218.1 MarR family transcriptional regulator [Erysipelothrix sp. HDW6C]